MDDASTVSGPSSAPTRATAQAWRQPKIGSSRQHAFFYWLIRLGGRTRAIHISWVATLWYTLFYPSIRKRCRYYLNRRFPDRTGPLQRFRDTYHLVRTYGETLVDMLVLRILGPTALSAESPTRADLRDIAQKPEGFVLLHAHAGCWQVGMSTLGEFEKPISIVMIPEPKTVALLDKRVAEMIDPRTGLPGVMLMTQALLRGDVVTMMGDRTFGDEQNTVPANFLGGEILLPITPYRLASATGVPIVVMMAPRTGKRTYEMRLAGIIHVPPGLGKNSEKYRPYAQEYANCLEKFVGEFPWQFYNFYDLWERRSS